MHEVQARRAAGLGDRPAPQPRPRPDEDAQHADRPASTRAAEYEAAKDEPVELRQQVSADWKAPHFVWQVRRELGQILCPETPNDCPEVDTGGYQVITTLDWKMQQIAEKWVYVAARAPERQGPDAPS